MRMPDKGICEQVVTIGCAVLAQGALLWQSFPENCL
jgi:hypothetical protein